MASVSHPTSGVSTPPTPSPRIGELFAGYGGLGMGVQAVYGGSIAWVSEFDKGPSKILAHRFPGVPNHGDITTIDWSQVEPVDILTGGSPCQDLSHAGKRGGMTEGTRSNLWVAMREAIAQLRPTTVVWENVRGAFSAEATSNGTVVTKRGRGRTSRRVVYEGGLLENADGGPTLRALGRVLGDLSDLGYDAQWHGLRAAEVGAPHGRFRVFVVATDARGVRRGAGWSAGSREASGGWSPADAAGRGDAHLGLLPTPTSRDFKNAGDPAKTAGRMADRGQPLTEIAVNVLTLLPTPRASDGEKGGPNQRGSSGDLMLPAAVQPERLLPTPHAGMAERGASNPDRRMALNDKRIPQLDELATVDRWGDYAAAIARWERTLGRPAPEPTILSKKGSPQLSPAFVEWMMGLPAGWVTGVPGITRNEALKALGNGVMPQQCAAALRIMLAQAVAA